MHPSAKSQGKLFFDSYLANKKNLKILDIGSMDVNGSLKEFFDNNKNEYYGLDMQKGPNVNILMHDPYIIPFDNESVDVIISTSVFEHTPFFWELFIEMNRVLKPSGLIYLNMPSNGDFHRYPKDCWRFYPDSGIALVDYAKRKNFNTYLLESFINSALSDCWNDFVAVFIKDKKYKHKYKNRIFKKNSYAINIISNDVNTIKNMKTEWFDYKSMFFRLLIQKIKRFFKKIA